MEIVCSAESTVFRVREQGSARGTLLSRVAFVALAVGYGLALSVEASRGETVQGHPVPSVVYIALCVIALSASGFQRDRRWPSVTSREVLRIGPDGIQTKGCTHPLTTIDGIRVLGPEGLADFDQELDCRARGVPLWPSRVYAVVAVCGNERNHLALGLEAHQAKVIVGELATLLEARTAGTGSSGQWHG